jgi:peroxiredoxin
MRTVAALAILICTAQDSEVVKTMRRFFEQREKVKSAEEFRKLVIGTRDELDAWLRKAGAGDADRPRAMFHAAEMHLFLNDPEGAYTRFEAFVRAHPSTEGFSPAARFLLGELSLQLGKDARARDRFAEFVKADPADSRVFGAKLLSAMSFVNEAKYEEAASALVALGKEPLKPEEGWSAGIQLALCYHLMEKNDDAKRALEAVIKTCTDLEMCERSKRLLTDWLGVGKPAPPFEGKDTSGAPFKRPEGKVTLLYFFTVTFDQAAGEVAMFRRMAETFGSKGAAILGVSIDKQAAQVEQYVQDYKVTWPIACDGDGFDGPMAKALGVKGLPFVMVIDKKGVVRFHNPLYSPSGREVLPVIEKLLAEK